MANVTGEKLKFGTSGLRGLASLLSGTPAFSYTASFLRMLLDRGEIRPGEQVLLARDLRESSPQILRMCASGVEAAGLRPVDCGAIPTPALALAAMQKGLPAIMVTGSHIPADRNGLKFYLASGEIDKDDEAGITAIESTGIYRTPSSRTAMAETDESARAGYIARYRDFFEPSCLAGLRLGVWQHSSVARDLLVEVLSDFGAKVVPLGRAPDFVAVDTEAVSVDDREQARQWTREQDFDAIVSTDGDADRPLIFDGDGNFVDGDLLGAIAARALGADVVVSPVTSNSGLERCGFFSSVRRCHVGSPYVIEEMQKALAPDCIVVGFEANGGVLLGSRIIKDGRSLEALPTRDCLLPLLCCLSGMVAEGRTLAQLASDFGFKAKAAGRLENISQPVGAAFLAHLTEDGASPDPGFVQRGKISILDTSDGIRLGLGDDGILHFRMSGNAPELRCYTESVTLQQADELLRIGFKLARDFLAKGKAL